LPKRQNGKTAHEKYPDSFVASKGVSEQSAVIIIINWYGYERKMNSPLPSKE